MDNSVIHQKTTVTVHEKGGCQTFVYILHLRIRERKPYLLHLVFAEEPVDDFNVRTKKSHIFQAFLQGLSGPGIDTCALDVYPDEVDVRIDTCQPDSIFPFPTAQFEHNRVVIMEILRTPTSLHIERNLTDDTERILKDITERLHLCEFL